MEKMMNEQQKLADLLERCRKAIDRMGAMLPNEVDNAALLAAIDAALSAQVAPELCPKELSRFIDSIKAEPNFGSGWLAERICDWLTFPKPRQQSKPCGECHLQPGERCDICGAKEPSPVQGEPLDGDDPWENGTLGRDAAYAKRIVLSPEHRAKLMVAAGLTALDVQVQDAAAMREQFRAAAEGWGDALNEAGWEFMDSYRRHTGDSIPARLFNNAKTILRDCILVYSDKVALGSLSGTKATPVPEANP